MKRRVNVYLGDDADDILIAIFSYHLRRKIKTSQSKIIEDALIFYHDNKHADEVDAYIESGKKD